MNNCFLMYRVSTKRLRKMNYCNGVEDFINYALSNLRNINGDNIRCSYKKCKNKNFLDPDVVTMHLLQKKFMEKYLCRLHMENHIFLTRHW
jgi:hypothetical protein